MKTKTIFLFLIFFNLFYMNSRTQKLPEPQLKDKITIGKDLTSSTSSYNNESQTYTLNINGPNSQLGNGHLVYTKVSGDFILTCRVDPESTGEAGVAIMNEEGNLIVIGNRELEGSVTLKFVEISKSFKGPKKNYESLQMERIQNRIILRAAGRFEPLQIIGEAQFDQLLSNLKVGLWLDATKNNSKAVFSNVRLDEPVSNDYNGDQFGHLGSRLEIIDVKTGQRKILLERNERFEAPNFMPDGKNLIFNQNGLLHTIPVQGGDPVLFPTGFANKNNNDHGISFDGKLLAISHHRDGLPGGGSTVYIMPLSGGDPKLITENTPSYWHGWNPNNREVVYVAQRNGSNRYQLYKKDIYDGPEIALTNFDKGHVDGPEYSPDGKHIYYNGSQTGTMQIWRMSPEGKQHEQLTFDELNNWFPHISPDGKWIAYLSFPSEIHPDDHPAYKRVQLRLIPVTGGAPRVIAQLYGGQGTINVPSWSPDNRYIAFVSNSIRPKR